MSTENEENVYYALALPEECESSPQSRQDLVFTQIRDALSAVKQYKGSRFKTFKNYEEALRYCSQPLRSEEEKSEKDAANEAEGNINYKAPHPRELAELRKQIEFGNSEFVFEKITSNPRFLVSSGDAPVILMEGPRYNAFHCCCKSNQPSILNLILNTIKQPSFMRQMYPNDDELTTKSRIDHILDLYLNTPDKILCETPLHFACKHGAVKCVEILLSQNCDVEKVNKQNKKPIDCVCERGGNSEIRSEIISLFESRYYVSVIRDFDRVEIGKPDTKIPENTNVHAIAGPMSPNEAQKLYEHLKSPHRRGNSGELEIRLTDSQKGVERVARSICRSTQIKWTEFWPFLDCHVDLASDEGLRKLENHLRRMYDDISMKLTEESPMINDVNYLCKRLDFLDISNDDSYNLNNETFDDIEEETSNIPEIFVTAPSSPQFLFDCFVNGPQLTNWDEQAALALTDVEIDKDKYPYIKNWLNRIPIRFIASNTIGSPTLLNNSETPRRSSMSIGTRFQ
ncbi:ankyrin repeat and LEM domain-containing protein 2-like isoform X1 [Dinothrombium tinctorium]|uniref:Ankyrin repeat and LEM domain-containing protein 2-like isoform X1 n=1 Tax=Dinothrombium tinctorium TaxID=1965070 RepID=A0A443R721_9ACAR|nr:ankyrin repeat and LEM domain-containing protein 2-like isoform X1 [Dinothrombium tinctorium]